MAMFKGFKPQGLQKIATRMGYAGSMENFDEYLKQNPDKEREMIVYRSKAQEMAKGGAVRKMAVGGVNVDSMPFNPFQAGTQAVVYGPDGTQYGNGMIAERAGVTDYSYEQPSTVEQFPIAEARLGGNVIPAGETDQTVALQSRQQQQPVTQVMTDPRSLPQQNIPQQNIPEGSTIGDVSAQQAINPALPTGATVVPVGTQLTQEQMLAPDSGQVSGTVSVPTAMAQTTMAQQPTSTQANLMDAQSVAEQVNTSLDTLQAAQTDPADPRSQILAAQQTASSVGDLSSAQGNATLLENPVQRQIQQGELVSGAANAETASTYAEQIQAATATPTEKATVQGQLAQLTADFDATNPPAWAAGALRGVQAVMQQRGLGASSMAGQAMIQAALESALPIAQADAQVTAQFEAQNLSNKQQRAMLAAQQRAQFIGQEFDQAFQARVQNSARIGDIANMNFTAEQNIALENSRAVNTMNLNNLSNRQAMVMAEASALANLDMSNLNNRQQAAVQNAQNFLQMDMANLSNQQQTNLFKAQQRTQSLFTDQAATNAARQFNASSQNQVDQFFANLGTQVAQFNATQANAQSQFNAGQANTVERFNAELNNQRDQFNAQNQLVIAQSNAQWRRQIATADTASVNRANELNANALLNISKTAYDNLWQHYADTMEWAWTSAENELDRIVKITTAELTADAATQGYKLQADAKTSSGLGSMVGTILTAGSNSLIGGWLCWVAREIYGSSNPKWVIFRSWMDKDAPSWFKWLYGKYGKQFAMFIKDKPKLKKVVKYFMDKVVTNPRYLKGIKEEYEYVSNI